jgi:hypothetical protein
LKKKLSFADVVKKPPLTGGNLVPINHQKEWRPRIILDNSFKAICKGRTSISDRLGSSTSRRNSLIPRKYVFSIIQFDLSRAEAKRVLLKVIISMPLIINLFLIV